MDFDIEVPDLLSADAVWFGKQKANFLLFSIIE